MAFDGSIRTMTEQELQALPHDDLAVLAAKVVAEVHRRVEENGTQRQKFLAEIWHERGYRLAQSLIGGGQVQPFSGGDPKTPPSP